MGSMVGMVERIGWLGRCRCTLGQNWPMAGHEWQINYLKTLNLLALGPFMALFD
ncbi:hypothetical protein [Paenibacillus albiflavus]|uniref:hypothetical protein n=1 Tax=Paenibacillus albiflavus TaxID=2545760 RepID=UPI001404E10B|nr:hypothetical protein [Paenibacillus albiflavus]